VEIVRHLKDSRQKIDGVDYAGSFACSRGTQGPRYESPRVP
jgi:hypothetical protein